MEERAVYPATAEAKVKLVVTWSAQTTCTYEGQELLYPEIDTPTPS